VGASCTWLPTWYSAHSCTDTYCGYCPPGMAELPSWPQLPRTLSSSIHGTLKNGSSLMRHPALNAGKVPHWLPGAKVETPSRRTVAVRR
jgi:hypothetical protein